MKILVTGGAGYIGSQFVRRARSAGYQITVLDNLSRGHRLALSPEIELWENDLLDFEGTLALLKSAGIEAVVHFAAFAYVGESVVNPELYYLNNVVGSYNLLKAIHSCGIEKIVFSSTCSVYGNPGKIPIGENETVNPINPYANTKLTIEKMLDDFHKAYGLKYVILRYFNAAGADSSGHFGESHNPEPHLIPKILSAALDQSQFVNIYGDDYNTKDGTCVRDYIHIDDLAEAHLMALDYLNDNNSGLFNLGTGEGNSVKEIIELARKITGRKINYKIDQRRKGDPAVLVADSSKALNVLGWKPGYSINDILATAWKWHQNKKY